MTPGDKWIRFLRAYGPVPEGNAQEAEHVPGLSSKYGCSPLRFAHPAEGDLKACFPTDGNPLCTVVLTGIAGDGKSTLLNDLIFALSGVRPVVSDHSSLLQRFTAPTANGPRDITTIFDVSGWRDKAETHLIADNVNVLHAAAHHARTGEGCAHLLAVNDGQMHRSFRLLPDDAPPELHAFGKMLATMHATDSRSNDEFPFVRLINLSRYPNRTLMEGCLQAVIDSRAEWECLTEEMETNPLFGSCSPIPANYALLLEGCVRERLITLADLADAAGYHLTIRSLLILLSNALLGHSVASDGVLGPSKNLVSHLPPDKRHLGALHRNLFGYNLKTSTRQGKDVFRFLEMLKVGEETTADLDDLLIFGKHHPELVSDHAALIVPDVHSQRHPGFDKMADDYVGGVGDAEDGQLPFLKELAHERRRIFLHVAPADHSRLRLWECSVFHYAGHFLERILAPIRAGTPPATSDLRKIATGLNRTWTGLLVDGRAERLHLAVGLDLTTSAVSDILLKDIEIADDPPGFEILRNGDVPQATIRAGDRAFSFTLSLPRFEFLMRVADGAMPSSFSRESYEDFLSLKQCCLRELRIKPPRDSIKLIHITSDGQITTESIRTDVTE